MLVRTLYRSLLRAGRRLDHQCNTVRGASLHEELSVSVLVEFSRPHSRATQVFVQRQPEILFAGVEPWSGRPSIAGEVRATRD